MKYYLLVLQTHHQYFHSFRDYFFPATQIFIWYCRISRHILSHFIQSYAPHVQNKRAEQFVNLEFSIKTKGNIVTISLILPRNESLNYKVTGNRLRNMRNECSISFIEPSGDIEANTHLKKSKLHFNKLKTVTFAMNFAISYICDIE